MKKIGAAKFKEQCLSLLENLSPGGLIITKHGRPIAKLIPVSEQQSELIGCFKGRLKISGNIMSSDTAWDAES